MIHLVLSRLKKEAAEGIKYLCFIPCLLTPYIPQGETDILYSVIQSLLPTNTEEGEH